MVISTMDGIDIDGFDFRQSMVIFESLIPLIKNLAHLIHVSRCISVISFPIPPSVFILFQVSYYLDEKGATK